MNNHEMSESRDIIMQFRHAAMYVDPAIRVAGLGVIKLIQFMGRMRREGKLKKGDFKSFQSFLKLSEGKYTLCNLPIEKKNGLQWFGKDSLEKELQSLKDQGIRYYLMPDLNENDSFVQLAIYEEDKEKFSLWQQSYFLRHLSGGEHEIKDLNALTGGNTSLINIPLEGKEEVFQKDFETLGINYGILPDLRVGDGDIQLIVANNDMQKVEHWYKMYQKSMLEQGETMDDLQKIDYGNYEQMGVLSEEAYIDTASPEIKKLNAKYENQKQNHELTNLLAEKQHILRTDESMQYDSFEKDIRYQKFTINHETLVVNGPGMECMEAFEKKGFFISRVPGTYEEDVNYLLVPVENVFSTHSGTGEKTYTAFLEKEKMPMVLDKDFNLIGISKRKDASELFEKHYDLSKKERHITQKLQKTIGAKEKLKAPSVPLKVK